MPKKSKNNVKTFPINFDKKSAFISEEIKAILDKELGKDTYVSYIQIVSAPNIGKTKDSETEVVSFTFTFSPENQADEDHGVLIGLLLEAISKDPAIGKAVYDRYASKFGQIITSLMESEEDEASEEVN
jgi:hypothetical protein